MLETRELPILFRIRYARCWTIRTAPIASCTILNGLYPGGWQNVSRARSKEEKSVSGGYLLREAFEADRIATPKAHYAVPAGFPTRGYKQVKYLSSGYCEFVDDERLCMGHLSSSVALLASRSVVVHVYT